MTAATALAEAEELAPLASRYVDVAGRRRGA